MKKKNNILFVVMFAHYYFYLCSGFIKLTFFIQVAQIQNKTRINPDIDAYI